MMEPPVVPQGWHPDPFGRYAQRFWDGSQWSDHVMDANGAPGTDSSVAGPQGATAVTASPASGAMVPAPTGHASAVPVISAMHTVAMPVGLLGHPRRLGKIRRPWGVWLLTLLTLGIYLLYWWYKVNEEVREFDERIDVQPGIAVLALIVPIASWVTLVKTAGRISRAQQSGGVRDRCSGALGILLVFLAGTYVVYYQSQLNKLWRAQEAGANRA